MLQARKRLQYRELFYNVPKMPKELISQYPEVPAALIAPKKVGRIRGMIERNQATIISLIILTPSVTIPAYYDWRHPIIGMIL